MKTYFLTWILRRLFAGNPCAEFTSPVQSGKGWAAVLKDKINGQEYLATFVPIESEVTVMPDTVNQFLKMTERE